MGNTFTSWSGLVLALQQEVAEATAEVIDASMDDLFMNTDQFYSSSEGRYHRTGMLRMSPQSYFSGGGSVSTGEISLNTGHGYSPSGRDTRTIYGYAENGGLLGNGGFWADTMSRIPAHLLYSVRLTL